VKYLMRPDELVPAVRTALDSPMLMIQRPDLREKALEAVAALVAERDRYETALRDIEAHIVVSESEFPDENCNWHCTAEIVAKANTALAGAARAAQEDGR
jgi:hypothetical protein